VKVVFVFCSRGEGTCTTFTKNATNQANATRARKSTPRSFFWVRVSISLVEKEKKNGGLDATLRPHAFPLKRKSAFVFISRRNTKQNVWGKAKGKQNKGRKHAPLPPRLEKG
jgi:hypothetical protein